MHVEKQKIALIVGLTVGGLHHCDEYSPNLVYFKSD